MPSTPKHPRTQARFDPSHKHAPDMIELVDPSWILKALGLMFGIGFVCAYTTLCIVFSHTQWQIVLHPTRTVATTPATLSLPFTDLHFGPDTASQLDGWWIPSDLPNARTALMLHGATGDIATALPAARLLHQAHLNVLLFDYRGYGHSTGQHPTQQFMQADAQTALDFLVHTRHIPASTLVIYGSGVGASLALHLCSSAPIECPALVLDAPEGDLRKIARTSARSAIVPVSLLFTQTFPLAAPLATSHAPKLLITYDSNEAPALRHAAEPRMLVELPAGDPTATLQALNRFLSEYNPQN
jgi:pimeloyl-ACP methyl ester carboxylesterase